MISFSLSLNTITQSQFGDRLCRNNASEHGGRELFRTQGPSSRIFRNNGNKVLVILVLYFQGELGAVGEGGGGVSYFVKKCFHLGEDTIEAGGESDEKI